MNYKVHFENNNAVRFGLVKNINDIADYAMVGNTLFCASKWKRYWQYHNTKSSNGLRAVTQPILLKLVGSNLFEPSNLINEVN